MSFRIQNIDSNNFTDAILLLRRENLPTEDFYSSKITLFGLYENKELMGCIGFEQFVEVGLLRSLVVKEIIKGKGLGRKLVMYLEEEAKKSEISELYLLTETAEAFFHKLNYERIDRTNTPSDLLQSEEFSHLCPDTAVLMMKKI